MSNPCSPFMRIKNFIAEHYGQNVGKMLIHTGIIAWILSSAAQVTAIAINDKIPKEQKMFLIPQECADAAVNIASFYLITQSAKIIGSQLVKTGKWLPKSVRKFLETNKTFNPGKIGTDIEKDVKLPPKELEDFKNFSHGMDFIFTTGGSILSCNIITPIIRNKIAAERQKKGIERMNAKNDIKAPYTVKKPVNYLPKPTMIDFQARSVKYPYRNSDCLKI